MNSTILVIDDDPSLGRVLGHFLEHKGYRVLSAATLQEARQHLRQDAVHLAILDIRLGAESGLDLLRELARRRDRQDLPPPVIVITAENTPDNAIEAMGLGAVEYLVKPFDLQDLQGTVERILGRPETQVGQVVSEAQNGPGLLVGRSPAMQEVYKRIGLYSRHTGTVLIQGESGVGKELVAQAIHRASSRASQPFVAINMSAIPDTLLESELFGYEKGSFTSAEKAQPGKFRVAHGGTLFLDEIGDMPMAVQAKLLRVLQEREVTPIGSTRAYPIDVRVIAATQVELHQAIDKGLFRQDLFFRLHVLPIVIPPLAERRDDIPELVEVFLRRVSRTAPEPIRFSAEALAVLTAWEWPGNVRELMNVVERVALLAQRSLLTADDVHRYGGLPEVEPRTRAEPSGFPAAVHSLFRPLVENLILAAEGNALDTVLAPVQKVVIEMALEYYRGNQIKVAAFLGVNRNTLRKMLTELDIDVSAIKDRVRRNDA